MHLELKRQMEESFHKKKALVVVTSTNILRSPSTSEKRPTGCNLKELAYLYEHLFKPHPKISWTIASPAGSEIPLDPTSAREREHDNVLDQFMNDKKIQDMLRNSPPLSKINPKEYSSVFFIGGPGSMLDLPEQEESIRKIVHTIYYKNSGIVASIGHGLSAIVGLKFSESEYEQDYSNEEQPDSDEESPQQDESKKPKDNKQQDDSKKPKEQQEESKKPKQVSMQSQCSSQSTSQCTDSTCSTTGKPKPKCEEKKKSFLQNREVTGMSREEDEEQGLKEFLPFSLEERASENGAKFVKKPKFTPNVVSSERIVTAQNEQSTSLWVQRVIETCRSECGASKPKK